MTWSEYLNYRKELEPIFDVNIFKAVEVFFLKFGHFYVKKEGYEIQLNLILEINEVVKNDENFKKMNDNEKFLFCSRYCGRYLYNNVELKSILFGDEDIKKDDKKISAEYLISKGQKSVNDIFYIDEETKILNSLSGFTCSNIILLFNKILNKYPTKSRQIIKDYIVKKLSKEEIKLKYSISLYQLGLLIMDFRKKFAMYCFEKGYVDGVSFLERSEFKTIKTKAKHNNYTSSISRIKYDRKILGDIKIIELVKNLPAKEVYTYLNISEKRFNEIIFHTKGKSKFWLFEIQKLREKFFPNYTLEELARVG